MLLSVRDWKRCMAWRGEAFKAFKVITLVKSWLDLSRGTLDWGLVPNLVRWKL